MPRTKVVTDSAADLPEELVEALDISVVQLDVRIGPGAVPARGLPAAEFWSRLEASGSLAETSAPSPGAFREVFSDAARSGAGGVVCVTLSSELSATHQAAMAGAAEASGDIPVTVIDSRTATMGEGFVVLEAAEAAAAGAAPDEVAAAALACIEKVRVLGTLESLETLRRGGRIGSAQAFFGSLLSIKPVIEVRGGVVVGESRQRTRGRSIRYLAERVASLGAHRRLAVVHAAAADVDVLVAALAEAGAGEPSSVGYIGPVIGAHTGPGTLGVCVQLA